MQTAELPNPVINDDFEAQLRQAAENADRDQPFELPSAEQSDTRADTAEAESTSKPDTTPESETSKDRPRDAQGRFTKTEDGQDIPEAERQPAEQPKPDSGNVEQTDSKPESKYLKAQKDQERLARNRQEFEEEKRREREAIAVERQRLEQERQQWQQQAQPQQQQQKPQFTSQDYADYADECTRKAQEARRSGDYDKAEELLDTAAKAMQASREAVQHEQTAQQQGFQHWLNQQLATDLREAEREYPEIKDRNSPLGQETGRVIEEFGEIVNNLPRIQLPSGRIVGGITLAAEVAKLRLKAGAASGLEEENKKLKAEVNRLNGLTQINGSGPTSVTGQKRFEDMSPEEQEQAIRRMSREVDSQ